MAERAEGLGTTVEREPLHFHYNLKVYGTYIIHTHFKSDQRTFAK